jgi:carbonic anhydrase
VLRVAGNVIDDDSLGSIEYAVDHLAVRLILVLSYQCCGAVKAAKETNTGELRVIGGYYSLDSGDVTLIDEK